MTTEDVAWTDAPPEPGRGSGRPPHYTGVATALRNRPKQWAIVTTADTARHGYTLAHRIRAGRLAAFRPAGAYMARFVAYPGRDGGEVRAMYTGPDFP